MRLRLTCSSIASYLNCPLQYRLRYIERHPVHQSPSLSFGNSLHEALKWFYSASTPTPPSLHDLLEYLEQCWSSNGYSSDQEEARYFCQAKSVLQIYYRNYAGFFAVPEALEKSFTLDVGFCELSGVIDRLDKRQDGGFEVVEYKTSRRLPPARSLEKDLQLPIYHLAVHKIWNLAPVKVSYHYLLHNHLYSLKVTPERALRTLEDIERVVREIEAEHFDPRRNNLCPYCDFLQECPIMKDNPPTPARPSAPHLDIGQAVDELLLTGRQLPGNRSRIDGLKGTVEEYLRDNSLTKVGGSLGFAYIDEEGSLSWEKFD